MVMISSVHIALLVIENNGHVTNTWHTLRIKCTGYFAVLKIARH